ncbi:MAG: peptide deformylase [Rhodospirillales bacterium CG15_BIG_FIL_POST_REV_8_21_14_020_66_15]|nr:MAG: peptide deformylase [Rhodospirillales bacterium CG15_BIG_FIL_POST_REV_8_21_14_020_66_15]
MAKLDIIVAPDPRLKRQAEPVKKVDDAVRRLMDDMLETMYAANGIGLAAPQVGVLKRIIVVDVARDDEDRQPLQMANPEVVWESEDARTYEEGCLSLPDHYADVVRPEAVKVRYLDRENEIRTLDADDILATCVQHEIDHLDGVLFVDHISSLKRNMIIKKLQKLKKQQAVEAAPA